MGLTVEGKRSGGDFDFSVGIVIEINLIAATVNRAFDVARSIVLEAVYLTVGRGLS
jgi:hypothetical protein